MRRRRRKMKEKRNKRRKRRKRRKEGKKKEGVKRVEDQRLKEGRESILNVFLLCKRTNSYI